MQDANGNQILVRYYPGSGVSWTDSSARINEIEDVRAVQDTSTGRYKTFAFTYNADATPHLTGIANSIQTGENYTLGYLSNQTLNAPFSPPVAFGNTALMSSVTMNGLGLSHQFQYDASGSGELSQVTLPYGAHLRWAYRTFTYVGGRTQREVQYRYLSKASGAAETTYPFFYSDAADATYSFHSAMCLNDASGAGQKCWSFYPFRGWGYGFQTGYFERLTPGGADTRRQGFGWTVDPAGNPYIGLAQTILEPDTANQKQTVRQQTLDGHGNVLTTKIYDYQYSYDLNNLPATATRTYTNTYLTDANYTSRYIYNRLVTSTVSNGRTPMTLVQNTIDGPNGMQDLPNVREHDASYGLYFTYRGNVTTSSSYGSALKNMSYDIGGGVYAANDGQNHSVSLTSTSGTNYAAPSVITANNDSNSNQNATYSSWLGLTSASGPNGAAMSIGNVLGWVRTHGAQYATVQGGPQNSSLSDTAQARWDKVANEEEDVPNPEYSFIGVDGGVIKMSGACMNFWQSGIVAYEALAGKVKDPFASQGVTTSFHRGHATSGLEPEFGSFGSSNNFFGIPSGMIGPAPIRRGGDPRIPRPGRPGPRRMIAKAVLIVLLPLASGARAGQVRGAYESFPSSILLEKTARLVKWQRYWEGPDSFHGQYVPLTQVKARIVRSRNQAALFVADLGISLIFFEGANPNTLVRYGEWRAGESNEAVAQRYIKNALGSASDADCVPLSSPRQPRPNMQAGTTLPQKRVCAASTAVPPFAQEERVLTFPELKPPPFDAISALGDTLRRLRVAIKVNIGQYVGEDIPKVRVVVPRFSLEDPYVFVYVDLGGGRQGGVVRFGPEPDGSWSGDKLVTQGPPNDVAWTVRQVKANAMETIEVP